jgi:hypothetical protein
VYNIDDPIWQKIYPPNGWNCRCYTQPLTQDEARDMPNQVPPLEENGPEAKQIIKDANIEKGFNRNAAMTHSIWGKWLSEQISGKKYEEITDRMRSEVNRIPKTDYVIEKLKSSAEDLIKPKLRPDEFERLFPNGTADTIIGEFKVGDDFFRKLREKDKGESAKLISVIKPTLMKPEFIIVDSGYGTLFIKAFRENGIVTNYAAIVKNPKGEDEVLLISYHYKKNLLNKLKGGKLLIYSRDSIPSGQGVASKQHCYRPARLSFNLLKENIIGNDNKQNEIWGETYLRQGIAQARINLIKYGVEGFYLNGGVEAIGYDKIDKYRKGVIISYRLNIPPPSQRDTPSGGGHLP